MPAFGQRASQHELAGRQRLTVSFTMVQSKQNRRPALLALHPEIPLCVDFWPTGNMHKNVLISSTGE